MLRSIVRALAACAFVAVVLLLAPTASAQFFPPPITTIAEDFSDPANIRERWQVTSGGWSASSGTFGSTTKATSIATIHQYPSILPGEPPFSENVFSSYRYHVRMRNPGTGPDQWVGLVYHLQDASNYLEIVFSPTGVAAWRRVAFGETTTLIEQNYAGGGPGVWFDVEIKRDEGIGRNSVEVNGVPILGTIFREFPAGLLGLVTHGVDGRFDKVSLAVRLGDENPFRETFDNPIAGSKWIPTWVVQNGTYDVPTVEAASPTLLLVPEQALSFTLRARMFNPYVNRGNLLGVVFHHEGPRDYEEVVFSPTGVAKVRRVSGNTTQTLATASYAGGPNRWFDVKFEMVSLNAISVSVDGRQVFKEVSTGDKLDGRFGLISHWSPGRVDDVWYERSVFAPLAEAFTNPPPSSWVRSGTWNTTGETLNATAVESTDIVATQCACWKTDFRYSARLLNEFKASGNLVGLVYNFQTNGLYAGDYYELVLSPTGIARLNKIIQGTRYLVASATHNVPRNVWFDLDVIRSGISTTVLVNGAPLFDAVNQGELGAGDVGVITHWSRGRFDDLNVEEFVIR